MHIPSSSCNAESVSALAVHARWLAIQYAPREMLRLVILPTIARPDDDLERIHKFQHLHLARPTHNSSAPIFTLSHLPSPAVRSRRPTTDSLKYPRPELLPMPNRLLQEALQTPPPRLAPVQTELHAVHAVPAAERVPLHRVRPALGGGERHPLVVRRLADRRLEALPCPEPKAKRSEEGRVRAAVGWRGEDAVLTCS